MASLVGLTLNTALLTIVIAQNTQFHIDRKYPRRYCGSKLARVLAEFCLSFYSPSSEHRTKRQITTECCYNECSLDYLLESYCASVDTERLNRIQSSGVQETRKSSVAPQAPKSTSKSRRARNKRNCLCKRRKRKKVNVVGMKILRIHRVFIARNILFSSRPLVNVTSEQQLKTTESSFSV
ncbi:unnamed protein product [Callosobruchus maculatus]|nr:unnamed protein product [Callosobruchus maculatus]